MLEMIKEWWPQAVFMAGMFASYVAGKERTRARIKEVTDDLIEVQKDLRAVNIKLSEQSVQLAAINANLEWLKKEASK